HDDGEGGFGRVYDDGSEERADYQSCKKPREARFKCESCDKRYRSKQSLQDHMRTHLDDDEAKRPLKCDLCGRGFTQATSVTT
ncbi:hypothetical protein PENTCL1PPCAC_1489, partial [Pristionchus entomophagus]